MTMLKLPHDLSEGTTSKGVEWKVSPPRKGSQRKTYVNLPHGPTGSQGAGYGKGYQKDGHWPTAPGADDGGNASDSWSTISEMNEQ